MAVTKKIEIDGNPVEFKASAAIPRIYRNKFGRDVYKDLMTLNDAIKDQTEDASTLDGFSLEMFEDLAFVMWSAAHPEEKYDSPDEWLDQFNTFSIYQILPELIDLWGRPMTTALFMLRCVELGLSIADLDLLTIGSVNDMFLEKSRDSMEWREQATQVDMDKF